MLNLVLDEVLGYSKKIKIEINIFYSNKYLVINVFRCLDNEIILFNSILDRHSLVTMFGDVNIL